MLQLKLPYNVKIWNSNSSMCKVTKWFEWHNTDGAAYTLCLL